jgi:hypothetical protein
MIAAAVAALVATLFLGVVVGAIYLMRGHRPLLVRLHLTGALVSVAVVVALVFLGPAPRAEAPDWGWPVGLLGAATALGYGAWRLPRQTRGRAEAMLGLHILAGVAGFFLLLAFIKQG